MMQKKKYILLTSIFLFVTVFIFAQKPRIKNVSHYYGLEYSKDYYSVILIDDPHLNIDSIIPIGVSDQQYIYSRKNADVNSWRTHYGLKYGYSKNKYLYFETGISYYKGGMDVRPNQFTDTLLQHIFFSILDKPWYKCEYSILEIPFLARFKPAFENKKVRTFPILTLGVGLGYATQKMYYYNFVENSYIGKNLGMTANLGLGIRRETENFFYELNGFYHPTLINHFAYAPIRSNYQPIGIELKFGYQFSGKSFSQSTFMMTCKSFSEKLKRYNLGVFYAGNYSFLVNTGEQKNNFTLNNHPEIDTTNFKSNTTEVTGIKGYSAGVYSEFRINPIFSVGFSPCFSQRGFRANDSWVLWNNTAVTTYADYKMYYVDIPVEFNFRPINELKIFAGGVVSIFMTDKVYDIVKWDNGYVGGAYASKNLPTHNRILLYFKEKPRDYLYGATAGASYELDNRLAITLRAQYTSNMMSNTSTTIHVSNATLSASILFYLSKNEFQHGNLRR